MTIPIKDPPRVTDHCLVRCLERAMGLNVELVRQHILGLCEGAAGIGAVCVRAEGLRFEISGGAVVTVTPDHQNPSLTSRNKNQNKIARSSNATA